MPVSVVETPSTDTRKVTTLIWRLLTAFARGDSVTQVTMPEDRPGVPNPFVRDLEPKNELTPGRHYWHAPRPTHTIQRR